MLSHDLSESTVVQVEDLEVYEPAVAEEEALPEPEAAPATKGEHGFLSTHSASFQLMITTCTLVILACVALNVNT